MDHFSHIGVFTNNPDRLAAFYTTLLGFSKIKEVLLSREIMEPLFAIPQECNLVLLQRGSAAIEIFSAPALRLQEGDSPRVGVNHWGLAVKDREAFCRGLEGKAEILRAQKSGKTIYFLKDPDGNRIEIQNR